MVDNGDSHSGNRASSFIFRRLLSLILSVAKIDSDWGKSLKCQESLSRQSPYEVWSVEPLKTHESNIGLTYSRTMYFVPGVMPMWGLMIKRAQVPSTTARRTSMLLFYLLGVCS